MSKLFLRLAAVAASLGFALRALFSDLPLREVLWDERWWGWFARLAGFSWKDWVTSPTVETAIEQLGAGMGWGMLLGAGIILCLNPGNRLVRAAAWIAFFILLLQHFLSWKEHFWQLGQLLEYTLLTATPLIYLLYGKYATNALPEPDHKPSLPGVLIGLTFIGHGLYAVGFHAVPANFVMMTQEGLGVGEGTARQLLFVVGILDFLAAGLLFMPWRKAWLVALGWIIPWALLTTLARWWSYQGIVSWNTLFTQWLPEVIIRLPHLLVPLALLFWRGRGCREGVDRAPDSRNEK